MFVNNCNGTFAKKARTPIIPETRPKLIDSLMVAINIKSKKKYETKASRKKGGGPQGELQRVQRKRETL